MRFKRIELNCMLRIGLKRKQWKNKNNKREMKTETTNGQTETTNGQTTNGQTIYRIYNIDTLVLK